MREHKELIKAMSVRNKEGVEIKSMPPSTYIYAKRLPRKLKKKIRKERVNLWKNLKSDKS